MKLRSAERVFEDDAGSLILRVLEPSPPHGAWPGTDVLIREWKICPQGEGVYRACTDAEVVQFERELMEIPALKFIQHPSLGCVATPVEAST